MVLERRAQETRSRNSRRTADISPASALRLIVKEWTSTQFRSQISRDEDCVMDVGQYLFNCLTTRPLVSHSGSLIIKEHLPSCSGFLHNFSTQSQARRKVRQSVQFRNHFCNDCFHGYCRRKKSSKFRRHGGSHDQQCLRNQTKSTLPEIRKVSDLTISLLALLFMA